MYFLQVKLLFYFCCGPIYLTHDSGTSWFEYTGINDEIFVQTSCAGHRYLALTSSNTLFKKKSIERCFKNEIDRGQRPCDFYL
ncbi:MAG: hypothetical protein DWQ10_08360 [Calditrichaeota bacterium]|nr:MAG: hypothetical protein DWQ10_08360 [Calditrichota bacterium]